MSNNTMEGLMTAVTRQPAELYEYHALTNTRAVRLLRFLPSSTDDEIHVALSEVLLDDLPTIKSVAISYVWGSSDTSKHYIRCGDARINVTENAAQVLSCFSRRSPKTTLWIDSVCINQASIAERNHQVTLMGEIYRSVTMVVVWLGQGNEACNKALEYCDEAANLMAKLDDWGDQTLPDVAHLLERVKETQGECDTGCVSGVALLTFCRRTPLRYAAVPFSHGAFNTPVVHETVDRSRVCPRQRSCLPHRHPRMRGRQVLDRTQLPSKQTSV